MKAMRKAVYILATLCCLSVFFAAKQNVDVFAEQAQFASVEIIADSKTFVYNDEFIVPSDFTVAEQIENRKINSPLRDKISYVDMCLARGADYKTALGACFPLLVRTVDKIADFLYVAPTDARIVYSNGKFCVVGEKIGRMLDENKLYASVYCTIKYGGGAIKAYTTELLPKLTKSELCANLVERSRYTTEFHSSTAARSHNIKLALGKIDGFMLPAGKTLSFNEIVGERTERNGFKSAKIIIDGKYTDGVGGGVCQASTAVYNAALLAGLECKANAHSICPSYCPPGLDAMISTYSDLEITNNTAHTVCFSVKCDNSAATVFVYGERCEYTVEPESVVLKITQFETTEITDTEKKFFGNFSKRGDRLLVSPGKDGIISETYLKYYKNGIFFKRVKIRTNEYKTVPQVIAVAP